MAKTDQKEKLFQDFYYAVSNSLDSLERQYNVTGVLDQIFGKNADEEQARSNLRTSRPWATLSALYDYAIDGIVGDADPMDIVIDGSDVLKLASSENHSPSTEWEDIVSMADGRYALDEGSPFMLYKVALLANVDIRTVRNAVSAGELVTFKSNDVLQVENASARRWLHGRRGFKPTVMPEGHSGLTLKTINSPADFGIFLAERRNHIGYGQTSDKLVVFHPSVNSQAISELEAGVFSMPLDTVFPIADFYQLDRKQFLECVMRVFFYEEMNMLSTDPVRTEVSE
jgi:hypothetical protein